MVIDFDNITAYGESCIGCEKKLKGLCEGCNETDGQCKEWKESLGCPFALCVKAKKIAFCGLCEVFPCELVLNKLTWDKNAVERLKSLAKIYKDKNI